MKIPSYMEYKRTDRVIFLNKTGLVLNRTLLKDLMRLARQRDYIVTYKGYIITDIFSAHMKKGNRMTFIEALSELIKLTSRIKYELPDINAIIYSREELEPFMNLCNMYQEDYHKFRKIYCKCDIRDLDSFKTYCKILEGYYRNEKEFDFWLSTDKSVSKNIKKVLEGFVSFLPNKINGMELF